jgi:hypothetical protein
LKSQLGGFPNEQEENPDEGSKDDEDDVTYPSVPYDQVREYIRGHDVWNSGFHLSITESYFSAIKNQCLTSMKNY